MLSLTNIKITPSEIKTILNKYSKRIEAFSIEEINEIWKSPAFNVALSYASALRDNEVLYKLAWVLQKFGDIKASYIMGIYSYDKKDISSALNYSRFCYENNHILGTTLYAFIKFLDINTKQKHNSEEYNEILRILEPYKDMQIFNHWGAYAYARIKTLKVKNDEEILEIIPYYIRAIEYGYHPNVVKNATYYQYLLFNKWESKLALINIESNGYLAEKYTNENILNAAKYFNELKDSTQMLNMLNLGIQHKDDRCMAYLSQCYSDGTILKENPEKSTYWLIEALKTNPNSVDYSYRLAHAYRDGYGVNKSLDSALVYINKSIELGNTSVHAIRFRDRVIYKMKNN